MSAVINDSIFVARKYYNDDTRWFIENAGLNICDVQLEEWMEILSAVARNWQIEPGMKYRRVVGKDGDRLYVFKASIPLDNICLQYDLYDE